MRAYSLDVLVVKMSYDWFMDPKLAELTADGNFREKVRALLCDLERLGEYAKIFEAKRTVDQQREKVRLGYSKTMRSNHLKRGADGGGKAADIADRSKGWNASRRFWFIIGASCHARGLGWGGLFGMKSKQKLAFHAAVRTLREAGWPESHSAYQAHIGWDPAHVEFGSNW